MPVPRVNPLTPYAMVVRFKPLHGSKEDTVWAYRKRLPHALAECARGTRAWLQMIGGQYPSLFYLVIDTRTGEEHHPHLSPRGVTSNGQEHQPPGTLH